MTYKILEEESRYKLEKKVNEKIEEGWEIVGGMSFTHYFAGYTPHSLYCQAMIKK